MIATIKLYRRFNKVSYYTVHIEDKQQSEFNDFIQKFNRHEVYGQDFNVLIAFIQSIGENHGAKDRYFKQENEASRFKSQIIEITENDYYGLRLYCLPISKEIVVIFNGCAKTTLKVQNCSNCKHHFHMANRFTRKILEAMQDKFIRISSDKKSLEIDDDFILIL